MESKFLYIDDAQNKGLNLDSAVKGDRRITFMSFADAIKKEGSTPKELGQDLPDIVDKYNQVYKKSIYQKEISEKFFTNKILQKFYTPAREFGLIYYDDKVYKLTRRGLELKETHSIKSFYLNAIIKYHRIYNDNPMHIGHTLFNGIRNIHDVSKKDLLKIISNIHYGIPFTKKKNIGKFTNIIFHVLLHCELIIVKNKKYFANLTLIKSLDNNNVFYKSHCAFEDLFNLSKSQNRKITVDEFNMYSDWNTGDIFDYSDHPIKDKKSNILFATPYEGTKKSSRVRDENTFKLDEDKKSASGRRAEEKVFNHLVDELIEKYSEDKYTVSNLIIKKYIENVNQGYDIHVHKSKNTQERHIEVKSVQSSNKFICNISLNEYRLLLSDKHYEIAFVNNNTIKFYKLDDIKFSSEVRPTQFELRILDPKNKKGNLVDSDFLKINKI